MKNTLQTDIAIQLINISKKYEIHHEKPTLVEQFVKGKNETFWALNNINLTIKKGERVGIVGANGSGKTTLLKIITGITTPTTGEVHTNGRLVSLIDLEAGFHEDLTGVQNIFINGMLLGLSHKQIKKKLSKIIAFADIKQFIDVPLYTYSSGMKLRLGFSVAIHAEPDIVVLDEGTSVGDHVFQKKITSSILDLRKKKKTLIIASHDMSFLKRTCSRIIMLRSGTQHKEGNAQVLHAYTHLTR